MKHLATIIDNIVALMLRQALTWSLTAVLMVFFLPRYLGDEGLGKITLAISVTMILQVLTNMGTAIFTVKEVALDRSRVSELLWNAYGIRLASGIALASVLVVVVRHLALEPDAKAVLYIAGATMIIMGLDKAQIAVIQGLEKMRWIGAAEVVNKATVMALGIAVLVTGHGVVAYALVLLVGAAMGLLVNGSYVARRHLRWPRLRLGTIRWLLIGGLPFFATGALGQVYLWMDIVILRIMTRDAVVGWLGAATQLYATVNFFPLVIITAMLPALTRFHAQDSEVMRVAVRKSIQAVLIVGIPLALALMLLSGDVIRFLHYPVEFDHSIPLLAVLSINMPVTGMLMLVGTIVAAANLQKRWAIVMLLTTVVAVALDPAFIWAFDRWYGNGAIGAVVVSVICETFMISIGFRLLPAGLVDRSVLGMLLRISAASVTMAGAMGAAKLLVDPGLIPLVLIGGPVYCVALLAAGGVTVAELRLVASSAFQRGGAGEAPVASGGATGYATAQVGGEGA